MALRLALVAAAEVVPRDLEPSSSAEWARARSPTARYAEPSCEWADAQAPKSDWVRLTAALNCWTEREADWMAFWTRPWRSVTTETACQARAARSALPCCSAWAAARS